MYFGFFAGQINGIYCYLCVFRFSVVCWRVIWVTPFRKNKPQQHTHIDPHFNLFYLLRVSLWRIRDLCEKNTNESHKYPHNMAGAGPFPFSLHTFSNYFLQIDVGHRVSNVSNRRIRSWRPGPGPKDIRQSNQRQVREPTFQLN